MESDKDIINKYLAGNKDYFEILVDKHLSHVFNFVMRYSGDREGAPDLVQETWLRVWRNLKKFDDKDLRAKIKDNNAEMLAMVQRFFHCG